MNCFVCPAAGSRPTAAGTGSPVRRAAPRRRSNGVVNIACFGKKCKQFLKIYLPILDVSFLSALRAGSGLFVSPHVRQFLPPVRACAPPKQRAGPLRRLPPAAAGAARLTRRDGHASLSQAPLYIDTRNAQKVSSILYFPKKLFRAVWNGDENFSRRGGFGRIPYLSFPRVRRAPCITARAPEPSVSPRGRQFLPPGRGCAAPQTARAQAPLRRFPLLRQGSSAGRGGTHTSLSQPLIYIDARNAQKVAPVLHFFQKIFSYRCG